MFQCATGVLPLATIGASSLEEPARGDIYSVKHRQRRLACHANTGQNLAEIPPG